jgi:hypothetical protein
MGLPTPGQMAAAPLSIVVFGMGLGESILLRATGSDGPRWAVVDSARRVHDRKAVNPALDTLVACDAHPEVVVLTHPHRDHTKGMADIVRRASPGAVVTCIERLMEPSDMLKAISDPDDRTATDVGQSVAAHAAIDYAWRKGRARRWPLHHGAPPMTLGEWRLEVLHPSEPEIDAVVAELAAGGAPNFNDVSAALVVERDALRIVLAADGEHAAWEAVQTRMDPEHLRETRPVKLPHHGSRGAIHPVLIDPDRPLAGREPVLTPFSQSGRLPRFEAGQGVERLLLAAGELHLTAMPRDLLPTDLPVTLANVRACVEPVEFAGDDQLLVHPQRPPAHASLVSGRRDPRECWVLLGVGANGDVAVTHGAHALHLV